MRRLPAFFCALTLLPLPALAQSQSARAQLDAFGHQLHAVTAQFEQTLTTGNGQAPQPSHGTLALEAPRQFRWDTQGPYQQNIVADGHRVWLYDPELQQVTVSRQDSAEAHSPLTVLTDLGQLDHEFHVSEQGSKDGLSWLRLTSTASNPTFDYVDLGFSGGVLQRMVFRDQLQSVTDIRFSHWQRNPPLKPDAFKFVPPKGADVVDAAQDGQDQPVQE
ncbi:outer membrane lipoprotein chaperone LolA [Frateuria aurantia]